MAGKGLIFYREYKKAQENFEKAVALDPENMTIAKTEKWFKDVYHKFVRNKNKNVCDENRK